MGRRTRKRPNAYTARPWRNLGHAKWHDQTCELRHTPEYPVRKGERDTMNVKQSQGRLRVQTLHRCDYVATRNVW